MAGWQSSSPARRFHDLARYRIREILLVSSPYDAFILEEDGQLTEQVFFEFRAVSLSSPPRVTHAASGEAAIEAMRTQRFDLILVMTSLADMGVNDFGRRVKKMRPGRPVVLLALDDRELREARHRIDPEAIDRVFLWTGDADILVAIVKFVEDRENVEHDVSRGNVRAIIMIEDSPRYYSAFLAILYRELVNQAQALYAEGLNELQRRMYIRSRPKILHATSYEEGVELFERYRDNVLAVISDVGIPRLGRLDDEAGLDFTHFVRRFEPDLPVLLQSAEADNEGRAASAGAAFVNKLSPTLTHELRDFMRRQLGFGDFVFRLPDGAEVARATDIRELERTLAEVPIESVAYHAAHNHFSVWLMARSEFALADKLRPKRLSDFPSLEGMRAHLIASLAESQRTAQRGLVSDYNRDTVDRDLFTRIGAGSLGGKARGIAFLHRSLADLAPAAFGGMTVLLPKTVVVTTEVFDEFVETDGLRELAYTSRSDAEIAAAAGRMQLPDALLEDLTAIVQAFDGPLAVRSSSLLEDSLHQPFAGIYSTFMIPNRGSSVVQRVHELSRAIRLVYASTFFHNARSYLESTGSRPEAEKMGVIIQRLVGSEHAHRFYPTFSGVAQSYNFYPVGPQKPEEGIVHLALGLGRTVVDGGRALRFSPMHPGVLPQAASPEYFLDSTQRRFFALDLDRPCSGPDADLYSTVQEFDLEAAEQDGTLSLVGSVYSPDDEQIRDDLSLPGPRLVTFANLLKHRAIPLTEALTCLLDIARTGMGYPVELEFACEMGDWGRRTARGRARQEPELYALQIRPFGARTRLTGPSRLSYDSGDLLCSTTSSLGHGLEQSITDVVWVRRDTWKASDNRRIASALGKLNRTLCDAGRPYLLIGPGRWGSADEWLGIPVQWAQISGARAIVEVSPKERPVEPSQGTHFFQNITSLRIGYLTLPPGAVRSRTDGGNFVDWRWLEALPAECTDFLCHAHLDSPLTVVLDGRRGRAVIAKPGAEAKAKPRRSRGES